MVAYAGRRCGLRRDGQRRGRAALAAGPAVRRRRPAGEPECSRQARHQDEPRLHVRPGPALARRGPERRHRQRHRPVGRDPRREVQRDGQHQRRRPPGRRGADRLGSQPWRRGQHRPGPRSSLPVDRYALRLGRREVGADRRRQRRHVRRRVRPALGAAQDVRGRQHDARHLVRRTDRVAGVAAVHGGQRRTAADPRGRRPVPVTWARSPMPPATWRTRTSSATSSTARSTPTTSSSTTCSRRCS